MKNIILGVSGSIACYKSYDLLRHIIKSNQDASVYVVLTKGAQEFLKPELFNYLGAKEVFFSADDFKKSGPNSVLHIDLARLCDTFILYPGSANTISKLSTGRADDLLSSIFLSLDKNIKKIIFPAMNSKMLSNPITESNLENLNLLKNIFIYPPNTGTLLCGEQGDGKIPLPEEVIDFLNSYAPFSKKRILISTGATKEPIDSVRYLTNPSSGITGFYLAMEFLRNGHQVDLISTSSSTKRIKNLENNPNFRNFTVNTTLEMKDQVHQLFPQSDLYISAAAPCDIKFETQTDNKLKKDQFKDNLKISTNPDILKSLKDLKNKNQKIIGFAAESSLDDDFLENKLKNKPIDLLVSNIVNSGIKDKKKGFSTQTGTYRILCLEQNEIKEIEKESNYSKKELSKKLRQWYESL